MVKCQSLAWLKRESPILNTWQQDRSENAGLSDQQQIHTVKHLHGHWSWTAAPWTRPRACMREWRGTLALMMNVLHLSLYLNPDCLTLLATELLFVHWLWNTGCCLLQVVHQHSLAETIQARTLLSVITWLPKTKKISALDNQSAWWNNA